VGTGLPLGTRGMPPRAIAVAGKGAWREPGVDGTMQAVGSLARPGANLGGASPHPFCQGS